MESPMNESTCFRIGICDKIVRRWIYIIDDYDCRSVSQLNIILHLLQDEFPSVSVAEETDDCVEAATALIRELEMIRDKKGTRVIQEAKVITDLLIP